MKKRNQTEKTDGNKTIKKFLSIYKQWIEINRKWLFIVFAILGIVLALLWFSDRECSVSWFFFEEIASFTKSIGTEQYKWLVLSLITGLVLWIFITIIKKNNRIKQWFLENRFQYLIIAVIIGILLGNFWVKWDGCLTFLPYNLKELIGIYDKNKGSGLDLSLITVLIGLPTLLFLWIFRTHDTCEQIEKTQNNTLTNILTHALDMITSNNLRRRSMGLIQLAQLKKQTKYFDAQIDAATNLLDFSTDASNSGPPVKYNSPSLKFSSLENMDLSGANFKEVDLTGAKLKGASLVRAHLTGSILIDANLSSTKLSGAALDSAFLTGSILIDANLKDAIMGNAKLSGATLSGAILSGADLISADLSGANLKGADLSDADLSGAILIGVNLSNACLIDANLRDAILSFEDQIDANLSDARDLAGAQYNDKTKIPKGFNPESRGMIKVDD